MEFWNFLKSDLMAYSDAKEGGRRRGRRYDLEEVVEASKGNVSVDCGQYRRRTSEGRPTFFPSEHRQIDIYSRSGFAFSCCSSLDRRVTDTPCRCLMEHDRLRSRFRWATIFPSDRSFTAIIVWSLTKFNRGMNFFRKLFPFVPRLLSILCK